MLFVIGTGLCDASDMTIRGMDAVRRARTIYLEGYTSLLQCSIAEFSSALGKEITVLSREDVEQRIEQILEEARATDIALLVIGDPFGATTHADLVLRARALGVPITIIHNTSIMNAVGELGLELYRYGKTVSIPYWQKGFEPTSFLEGIADNLARGLHTLCLLDIKADEERFMTVQEGLALLRKADVQGSVVSDDLLVVGVARLGTPTQLIVPGRLTLVEQLEFGAPPHCIVIPGRLHPIEAEMLATFGTTQEE